MTLIPIPRCSADVTAPGGIDSLLRAQICQFRYRAVRVAASVPKAGCDSFRFHYISFMLISIGAELVFFRPGFRNAIGVHHDKCTMPVCLCITGSPDFDGQRAQKTKTWTDEAMMMTLRYTHFKFKTIKSSRGRNTRTRSTPRGEITEELAKQRVSCIVCLCGGQDAVIVLNL